MELLFITRAEKRTVMCLCGVTGRSGQFNSQTSDNVLTGRCQGPVTTDRTRPVALNPHWNLTVLDRTLNPLGPVSTDRTRLVAEFLFWNLTGVDRTLDLSVRSLDHSSIRSRRTQSPWSNELTGPCGQCPVAPKPASGQYLTLHSLPTRSYVNEVCSKGP